MKKLNLIAARVHLRAFMRHGPNWGLMSRSWQLAAIHRLMTDNSITYDQLIAIGL